MLFFLSFWTNVQSKRTTRAEPEDHLWSADHGLRNAGLDEGWCLNRCAPRVVIAEVLPRFSGFDSGANPCEICGTPSDARTDIIQSTWVFPNHYHPTNAPCSSSSQY